VGGRLLRPGDQDGGDHLDFAVGGAFGSVARVSGASCAPQAVERLRRLGEPHRDQKVGGLAPTGLDNHAAADPSPAPWWDPVSRSPAGSPRLPATELLLDVITTSGIIPARSAAAAS